tara:strand:+ start:1630 stop:2106 length:477 start_codon:yes stop_codon:yes gene_type:complete
MKLVEKPLTEMQKMFCNMYVENYFGNSNLTNTQVAMKAGYASDSAYQRAYELLNPKISPHVVKRIGELKEDFRIKNNIDPDKHMARLNYLGQIAEENKMVGVALRAEELRGKVAGYYIDKQIIKNTDSIDNLSAEELQQKMKQILEDNQHFIEGKKDE